MTATMPKRYDRIHAIVDAIEHLPSASVLSLNDVSWDEYEELLETLERHSNSRISYDTGRLQIMTTSDWHDYYSRLIHSLIGVLTEELDLAYVSFGSATLKLEKKAKGLEADDCFYIPSAPLVIGKKGLEVTTDPPPDLAIEIDVWHQSQSKFPIYAALGVAEIWRYHKRKLHFYRLSEENYVEMPASDIFPFLMPEVLEEILNDDYIQEFNKVKRGFRKWVRKNKPR